MKQVTLKNGGFANIYRPRAKEAAEILGLLKQVGGETDFLLMDGNGIPISLEDEEAMLEVVFASDRDAMYVASVEGRIVGICNIGFPKKQRTRHSGSVGISLIREYWGQGLGRAMMDTLIARGREAGAHRLELEVRADNLRAIGLYERCGFKLSGRSTDNIFIKGEYFDELSMELML